jgi:hypothetical protein
MLNFVRRTFRETSVVTTIQGKSDMEYKTSEMNWFLATKQAKIERSNKGEDVDSKLTINTVKPDKYKPTGKDMAPLINIIRSFH